MPCESDAKIAANTETRPDFLQRPNITSCVARWQADSKMNQAAQRTEESECTAWVPTLRCYAAAERWSLDAPLRYPTKNTWNLTAVQRVSPLRRFAISKVDWGSVVGKSTTYGLDGPGIESQWGARFSAPVKTGPGAHPASCTMSTGLFQGVKRLGSGVDHPPHLAPKLKKQCIYTSPLWTFVAFSRVNFTFLPLLSAIGLSPAPKKIAKYNRMNFESIIDLLYTWRFYTKQTYRGCQWWSPPRTGFHISETVRQPPYCQSASVRR